MKETDKGFEEFNFKLTSTDRILDAIEIMVLLVPLNIIGYFLNCWIPTTIFTAGYLLALIVTCLKVGHKVSWNTLTYTLYTLGYAYLICINNSDVVWIYVIPAISGLLLGLRYTYICIQENKLCNYAFIQPRYKQFVEYYLDFQEPRCIDELTIAEINELGKELGLDARDVDYFIDFKFKRLSREGMALKYGFAKSSIYYHYDVIWRKFQNYLNTICK